jgi:hypothetical protein
MQDLLSSVLLLLSSRHTIPFMPLIVELLGHNGFPCSLCSLLTLLFICKPLTCRIKQTNMSWKLAELRWRHDIGLQDNIAEKRTGHRHSIATWAGQERTFSPAGTSFFQRRSWQPESLQYKASANLQQSSQTLTNPLTTHTVPDATADALSHNASISQQSHLLETTEFERNSVHAESTSANKAIPSSSGFLPPASCQRPQDPKAVTPFSINKKESVSEQAERHSEESRGQ